VVLFLEEGVLKAMGEAKSFEELEEQIQVSCGQETCHDYHGPGHWDRY